MTDLTGRIKALVLHLDVNIDEIEQSWTDPSETEFKHGDGEYLVLTDEEATAKAKEYILDSLWAFNAQFIYDNADAFHDTPNSDRPAVLEAMGELQSKLCGSASPFMKALIGKNLESFIENAIRTDGRGHFISGYDGEEHKQGEFYIYRVN